MLECVERAAFFVVVGAVTSLMIGCQQGLDLFALRERAPPAVAGMGGALGRSGDRPESAAGGQPAASLAGAASEQSSFSNPTTLTAVTSGLGERHPSFTEDGLELYFATARNGAERIWMSQRTSLEEPWGAPSEVAALNSAPVDTALTMPAVTSDGLTIYFMKEWAAGGRDLLRATRPDRASPFGAVAELLINAGGAEPASPCATVDATFLVLSAPRDPDPAQVLLGTFDASFETWSFVEAALNSSSRDVSPWISDDTATFAFSSDRGGDFDLYWRVGSGEVEPIVAVNSAAADRDPWLNQSLDTVVFSSNRDGIDRLYSSSR